MTPDERDLLDRFLSDLAGARPGPKDAEAAGRIDAALRANPDAAYVLVQHAILADHALADAQAHIAELESAGPPEGRGSFLGGLFDRGRGGPPPPAYAPPAYAPSAVPPTAGGPFGAPGGGYPASGAGPFSGGGGLGSFLRSAGTTAAGVAGGAFLFEGLSDMFGGHHHQGFGGFEGGGQGFADAGDRADFADAGGGPDFDYDDGQG